MVSRRRALQYLGAGLLAGSTGCLADVTGTGDDGGETLLAVSSGGTEVEAVSYGQVRSVGEVTATDGGGGYVLPVELDEDGVASFRTALEEINASESSDDVEMVLYLDGEEVDRVALSPGVVESARAGEFGGSMALKVESRETATNLRTALRDDEAGNAS